MSNEIENKADSQEIKILSQDDPELFELFNMPEVVESQKHSLSYMPALFTTASLPFKNVHKTTFVRKGTNGVTLYLQSPKNVPFGKYGRLLLSVLTTHAVLSKEKNIAVNIEYNSLADLMRELQLPKQRGADIREQLECFSNAAFSFEFKESKLQQAYLYENLYEDGKYPKKDVIVTTHTTGNIRFTNGVQFKEIEDGSAENKYGNFKIILSPEFAAFCQKHAVPIDYTVYREITSPVGKDIYAWLVYRNNIIDKPLFIPREKLVEQFMPINTVLDPTSRAKTESNNYNKIIGLVKEIKENYYPDLNVSFGEGGTGLTLYKSPTPVIKDDQRYALITSDI